MRWRLKDGSEKPRSKFGAQPTTVGGIKFDSSGEADRYRELKLAEAAGVIRDLELQPKFLFEINGRPVLIKSDGYPNGRQASYRADFRYFDNERDTDTVEDFKGHDTSSSRLRRAMVEAQYGVVIVLIRTGKGRNRSKKARKRPGSVAELRHSSR